MRATLLAWWFTRKGITQKLDAVIATHKIRTQQTVMPTAIAARLPVTQVPTDIEGIPATELNPESTTPSECATIDAIYAAQEEGMDTILVAGHSGTLYHIMGQGNDKCDGLDLDITDNDRFPKDGGKVAYYGDIWKVIFRPNGVAKFVYRKNLQPQQLSVFEEAH